VQESRASHAKAPAVNKVLVTGAAGFIGSHLVERLVKEGYAVRAFVHYNSANFHYNLEKLPGELLRQVEIVPGDLSDPFTVDRVVEGCQIVFHLAALISIPYSYQAPARYVSTNVVGTMNVLQACLRREVERLVHTSSSEVYGSAQYVPIDEEHPLVGQSPYSASKIAADKLVESFWHTFSLPVVTVRPFNTYGPRQSSRAIVPTILTQAVVGDTLALGSLDPVRDLTYVDDTVAGFLAAARSDACGRVLNLGVGEGYSIGQLVELAGELLGKKLEVRTDPDRVRPANSEVRRLLSNNSKAREVLGWQPTVGMREGMQRTLDYIRVNLADYKSGVYQV